MSYNMYAFFGLASYNTVGKRENDIEWLNNFQLGQLFVAKYRTVINYQFYNDLLCIVKANFIFFFDNMRFDVYRNMLIESK